MLNWLYNHNKYLSQTYRELFEPSWLDKIRGAFAFNGFKPRRRAVYFGDVNIAFQRIDFSLLKRLKVEGNLTLENCDINNLPSSILVTKNLILRDSKIFGQLPDNLYVGESCNFDSEYITHLPKAIHVSGSLIINRAPVRHMPRKLVVGQNLYLLENRTIEHIANVITVFDLKVSGKVLVNHNSALKFCDYSVCPTVENAKGTYMHETSYDINVLKNLKLSSYVGESNDGK